ncbi:MAG TPA: molybdopterin-dependent oxidoreductase [Terriglobales bacterium]|nr:molybdopterin-dependent oxidoreductase [Terriglobales bacterium]
MKMQLNSRQYAAFGLGLALLLYSGSLQGQQLTIQTESGKQTIVTKADLDAMPQIEVSAGTANVPVTYQGVALKALLEKAGVTFGDSLRGKRLASCLLVEAADGYRVVIALPEIDPAFGDQQIMLADSRDGRPLDQKEGPFRIVIPSEKRMARWVRQVTALKIVEVQ